MSGPRSPALDAHELRLLRQIADLGQDLLNRHSPSDEFLRLPAENGAQLEEWLRACARSENPFLAKLSKLDHLLSDKMTPRHFMNFLVPVERALHRDLKDADFMVSDTDADAAAGPRVRRPLVFVLENLRSSFNVGSIFRLADGLAVDHLCLCGYTPTPDRPTSAEGALHPAALSKKSGLGKAALGSERSVPFKIYGNTREALLALRTEDYFIVGLETAAKATPLFAAQFPEKTAILVGNERFGLDHESLDLCDALVQLPLHGLKNSLNVATALTAAAFEWTRQYESHRILPL